MVLDLGTLKNVVGRWDILRAACTVHGITLYLIKC